MFVRTRPQIPKGKVSYTAAQTSASSRARGTSQVSPASRLFFAAPVDDTRFAPLAFTSIARLLCRGGSPLGAVTAAGAAGMSAPKLSADCNGWLGGSASVLALPKGSPVIGLHRKVAF